MEIPILGRAAASESAYVSYPAVVVVVIDPIFSGAWLAGRPPR